MQIVGFPMGRLKCSSSYLIPMCIFQLAEKMLYSWKNFPISLPQPLTNLGDEEVNRVGQGLVQLGGGGGVGAWWPTKLEELSYQFTAATHQSGG